MKLAAPSRNGTASKVPVKPNEDETSRYLVVIGGERLVPFVEKAGFDYAREADLIDEDGGWIPLSRHRIEAAHRNRRDFVFLCARNDRFAIDSIGRLFKLANVPIPRTETPDPDRLKADPVLEVTRCILGLDRDLADGHTEPAPKPIPAREHLKAAGEVTWIWPGWIRPKCLHLVSADPDSGKSTILFDILANSYAGLGFPDGAPTPEPIRGKRALWIDADRRVDEQFPALLEAYFPNGEDPGIDFARTRDGERLLGAIDEDDDVIGLIRAQFDPQAHWAIVFDTLRAFMGSGDLLNTTDLNRVVAPLNELANELSVPIILLAHNNADGKPFGRHILGFCRSAWSISKESETARLVRVERAGIGSRPPSLRSVLEDYRRPLRWEVVQDNGFISPLGAAQQDPVTALENAKNAILRRLRDIARAPNDQRLKLRRFTAISRVVCESGVSETTFKRAMANMVAERVVVKRDDLSTPTPGSVVYLPDEPEDPPAKGRAK